MKLVLGWNGEIETPNTMQIESALSEMPGDENSFVILELKTGQFMQVHGADGRGFRVEYWENGKGHSCTTTELSLVMVVNMFRSYSQRDDSWRNSVTWEKMGKRIPIKTSKPRFTRKGILQLAIFAVLFLFVCIFFSPMGLMMGGILTIVPGMFIYIDLHIQKLQYSLPSLFFTTLANLVLLSLVIGILSTLPWNDWFSQSSIFPLGAFSLLLFWWGRKLIYLIQLQRHGVEEKPTWVRTEKYTVMGEAGSYSRSRLVYQYANGQIGRRDTFGGKMEGKKLIVRYLQDKPVIHQLIRK